jgi:hypothetical protein
MDCLASVIVVSRTERLGANFLCFYPLSVSNFHQLFIGVKVVVSNHVIMDIIAFQSFSENKNQVQHIHGGGAPLLW